MDLDESDYYIVAEPLLFNNTSLSPFAGVGALHYMNSNSQVQCPLPAGPDPFDMAFSINQAKSIRLEGSTLLKLSYWTDIGSIAKDLKKHKDNLNFLLLQICISTTGHNICGASMTFCNYGLMAILLGATSLMVPKFA
ncbi:uncharacterized protein [Euphorbia lathyris]